MTFGMEKREWCKKLKICLFILTIHERDRRTDTPTPYNGIGRDCMASRGKKEGEIVRGSMSRHM